MDFAAAFLFAPAAILAIVAVTLVVWGIRTLPASTTAGWLRIVAGIGVALAAVLALSWLFLDMAYGVVALPFLGILLGAFWMIAWLTPAGIVASRAGSRAASRAADPAQPRA